MLMEVGVGLSGFQNLITSAPSLDKIDQIDLIDLHAIPSTSVTPSDVINGSLY
jgi:hypothetical protein